MARRFDTKVPAKFAEGIDAAVAAVRRGELIVVATESAYALAADAFRNDALDRVRLIKGQAPSQPLPVLVSSVEAAATLAVVPSPAIEALMLAFWPGPLTIALRTRPEISWGVGGSTPGVVALRVPLHQVAWRLVDAVGPLAATSAVGLRDAPATCDEVQQQLGDAVAIYLNSGTPTAGEPSTMIDATCDPPRMIRPGALSQAQLERVASVTLDRPERSR